jgi:hypothetical protein
MCKFPWSAERCAWLSCLIVCAGIAVSGCSPIPLSVGQHQVRPNVETGQSRALNKITISGMPNAEETRLIRSAIELAGGRVKIVEGKEVFKQMSELTSAQFPVPLHELIESSDGIERVSKLADYIIVLDENRKLDTEIYVTVIDTGNAGESIAGVVHADGAVNAFWPPLPYLVLFVFYSEPDTSGSAVRGLGSMLAGILAENKKIETATITLLESGDLKALAASERTIAVQVDDDGQRSRDAWSGKSLDPIQMYRDMLASSREDDSPLGASMRSNPLYHAIVIPSVLMLSPMLWIIDKTLGDQDKDNSPVNAVAAEGLDLDSYSICYADKYLEYSRIKARWQLEITTLIKQHAPDLSEVADLYFQNQEVLIEMQYLAVKSLLATAPERVRVDEELHSWIDLTPETRQILGTTSARFSALVKAANTLAERSPHPEGDQLRALMGSEIRELPDFQKSLEAFNRSVKETEAWNCPL